MEGTRLNEVDFRERKVMIFFNDAVVGAAILTETFLALHTKIFRVFLMMNKANLFPIRVVGWNLI